MKWVNPYLASGMEGLNDAPGRGRKESIAPEKVEYIITKATQPPEGISRWSTRTMAKHIGVSNTGVKALLLYHVICCYSMNTFMNIIS